MPLDLAGIPRPPSSGVEGLEPALRVAARALAQGLKPPARRTLSQWAEAERVVSAEGGSPWPGRWSSVNTPYLVEIMDELSLSSPATEVVVKKGQQLGVTECGLNLLGQIAHEVPCTVLVTLPTLDTLKKYVETKFNPMVEATPAVRAAVKPQKSRDEDGSTSYMKKWPGGWASMTTASSSAGLQMISTRVYIAEEISEYPFDVGGRGDPLAQADGRCAMHKGREKKFRNSTPGIKGSCRITQRYEAGDQRQYYVPCPHCGDYQVLRWARMDKEPGSATRAMIPCLSCGCFIEQKHKRSIMAQGKAVWLKTFEGPGQPGDVVKPEEIEGYRARPSGRRHPSFDLPGLYSPVVTWFDIVDKWDESKGIQRKEKEFSQQTLGEAFEERGDAPDVDRLFDKRDLTLQWRRIPKGALFVTGAADVQGNRIEWTVYAWGVGMTRWVIDKGVIDKDPNGADAWTELDRVVARTYPDWRDEPWSIDAFGCDAGYLSAKVYAWALRHAGTGRVFALDGKHGWKLPALGAPTKRDIDFEGRKVGAVMLWPVGTWDLKSEWYRGLRNLLNGPDSTTGEWPVGTVFFGEQIDKPWLEQATAEHLADDVTKDGFQIRLWKKPEGKANEALDIAVYAAALAHHLTDSLTPSDWAALAARRNTPAEKVQGDLAQLWGPALAQPAPSPPLASPPAPRPPESAAAPDPGSQRNDYIDAPRDWLGARDDWLDR